MENHDSQFDRHTDDKKPLVNVLNFARWFFGVIFLLTAVISLTTSITNVVFGILLAVMLIPPFAKKIWRKVKRKIPTSAKAIAGIFFFVLMTSFAPKDLTQNQSVTAPSPTSKQQVEVLESTGSQEKPTVAIQTNLYQVVAVIDGDTAQVMIDGKKETLRLIGINSPEAVDPRKPVECFGKEASNYAKKLLTGKLVGLEADSSQGERDKYSRLLRYIILEGGTNFNQQMISQGYAYEYTYNSPYKYQSQFRKAQRDAQEEENGLWANNACVKLTATPKPVSTSTSGDDASAGSGNTNGTQGNTEANIAQPAAGGYSCAGKTRCGEMTSCEEARYYLNTCGVNKLDGDGDGTPCESLCN